MTAKLKSGLFLLSVVSVLFFVFSCKNETDIKRKLISRKWDYKEFKMNDESISGKDLGNPWMEFTDDGKYKAQMGVRLEEGEWRIEKNDLITRSDSDKKENRLQIKELTAEQLILYSETSGNKASIIMIPAAD